MSISSIGFVGLGAIGFPIARNLATAGFDLRVHTRSRTAENANEFRDSICCSSPSEVSREVDLLFICVSDDEAVEDVIFGSYGAFKSLEQGSFIIDLSTISPSKSKNIAQRCTKNNITYIDAPVTGGTEGAKGGTLTMFLGCDNNVFTTLKPILKFIAKNFYCFGCVGKGQEVKAINQILVAGSYAAVAEAIALGQSLDLPMSKVIEALGKGAASSWALSYRSQAMLQNLYPLGFKLELHHKDLAIALKTATDSGLNLPVTSLVKDIEKSLIQKGYGNEDISVLRRAI